MKEEWRKGILQKKGQKGFQKLANRNGVKKSAPKKSGAAGELSPLLLGVFWHAGGRAFRFCRAILARAVFLCQYVVSARAGRVVCADCLAQWRVMCRGCCQARRRCGRRS